jgi:hypothetical protein
MSAEAKKQPNESVERLLNEMRAIEYWDAAYCENQCHEPYEEMAFASRQKRRAEIIGQLMLCGLSWDVLKWKTLMPENLSNLH